mgnify:CR=1 FL=1
MKAKELTEPDQLLAALQAEMSGRLAGAERGLRFEVGEGPNVWLFVGVNGVGKTTTIGKVSAQQHALGRSVLMAAGDTFRAAAAEQLTTWAERSGAEIVRGAEGGDPSSVIFDGIERAAARNLDLVLADTAGRLHTKTNLMDELRKVRRVAEKGLFPSGTLFHPTFLYESLWNIALVGVVLLIERKVRLRPGRLMAVYVLGYSIGRFWVEGLRIDPANQGGGMRLNQLTAIVFGVGAALLLVINRRRGGPVAAEPAVDADYVAPHE